MTNTGLAISIFNVGWCGGTWGAIVVYMSGILLIMAAMTALKTPYRLGF